MWWRNGAEWEWCCEEGEGGYNLESTTNTKEDLTEGIKKEK